MTVKLNIGCGNRKKKGYVNIDSNRSVLPDLTLDVSAQMLPFDDCSVDEIFMNHSLEHIKNFWGFADEIMRVCKDGSLLHIVVPHSSCALPFYPQHYTYWSVASWETMRTDGVNLASEDYCKLRVRAKRINLHFLCHDIGPCGNGLWKIFKWWEWIWNRSDNIMQFAERLPFGWAEIEYLLIVDKKH